MQQVYLLCVSEDAKYCGTLVCSLSVCTSVQVHISKMEFSTIIKFPVYIAYGSSLILLCNDAILYVLPDWELLAKMSPLHYQMNYSAATANALQTLHIVYLNSACDRRALVIIIRWQVRQ